MTEMEYQAFEEARRKEHEKNAAHLTGFAEWLKHKGLSEKTIDKHVDNAAFYINEYLCRYEVLGVAQGCHEISGFLGDWFIRKALWSSCAYIKSTAASIKKFYAFLLEEGLVTQDDYGELRDTIKDEMPDWLEEMQASDSI